MPRNKINELPMFEDVQIQQNTDETQEEQENIQEEEKEHKEESKVDVIMKGILRELDSAIEHVSSFESRKEDIKKEEKKYDFSSETKVDPMLSIEYWRGPGEKERIYKERISNYKVLFNILEPFLFSLKEDFHKIEGKLKDLEIEMGNKR